MTAVTTESRNWMVHEPNEPPPFFTTRPLWPWPLLIGLTMFVVVLLLQVLIARDWGVAVPLSLGIGVLTLTRVQRNHRVDTNDVERAQDT